MNIQLIRHSKKKLQKLPALDQFTPTQAGFFDGFWPGSSRVTAKRSEFKRRLVTVPQQDEYPAPIAANITRPGLTPAFTVYVARSRKLQKLNHPPDAPATPPGFFDGFKPAFGDVAAFKIGFARQLQISPQLDEYPLTIPTPATLAAFLEKETFRRRDIERKILSVSELNQYPAPPAAANITRPGLTPAFTVYVTRSRKFQKLAHVPYTPATTIFEATQLQGFFNIREKVKQKRKIQAVIALPDTPLTSPPLIISGYPGSSGVSAFRSAFKIKLQTIDHPPVFPETPAGPAAPFAAYATIPKAHKWFEIAAHLQITNRLMAFRETDPAYYTGWDLAFQPEVKANRTNFKRKLQTLAPVVDFPLQPTMTEPVTSWQAPKQHRRHQRTKLQELPRLHTFPRIEPANEATIPPKTLRRRETARIIQFPLQLNVYPLPAPPPTPPHVANVINLAIRRKALVRRHIRVQPLFELPFTFPLAPAIYTFEIAPDIDEFIVPVDVDEFTVASENCLFDVAADNDEFTVDT